MLVARVANDELQHTLLQHDFFDVARCHALRRLDENGQRKAQVDGDVGAGLQRFLRLDLQRLDEQSERTLGRDGNRLNAHPYNPTLARLQ